MNEVKLNVQLYQIHEEGYQKASKLASFQKNTYHL